MVSDRELSGYDLPQPIVRFTLPMAGINNTTVGIRAGGKEYVWKCYQNHYSADVLRDEHRLLAWLATQQSSFAVPTPLPTVAGETLCETPAGYHALFPLLPGQRPDCANPGHIESAGAALGELHVTLKRCPSARHPRLSTYAELERIHPRLPHPTQLAPQDLGLRGTQAEVELCAWWRDMLEALGTFLSDTYPGLPSQVVHGDFTPGNTLVEDGQVTAMLDFEFASVDARAIDVAAGLKFSMRIWENPDPWQIGASFCRGYAHWVRLTGAESGAIMQLLILRDVASTIWWLGRALAAGEIAHIERIGSLREYKRWLLAHQEQFAQILTGADNK